MGNVVKGGGTLLGKTPRSTASWRKMTFICLFIYLRIYLHKLKCRRFTAERYVSEKGAHCFFISLWDSFGTKIYSWDVSKQLSITVKRACDHHHLLFVIFRGMETSIFSLIPKQKLLFNNDMVRNSITWHFHAFFLVIWLLSLSFLFVAALQKCVNTVCAMCIHIHVVGVYTRFSTSSSGARFILTWIQKQASLGRPRNTSQQWCFPDVWPWGLAHSLFTCGGKVTLLPSHYVPEEAL